MHRLKPMGRFFLSSLFLSSLALANSSLLPNAKLTPGVVNPEATREKICKPGYTHGKDVRHVTLTTKKEVFKRYGIAWSEHSKYEVDHLISLEIGGANNISNLWPEAWEPRPGAHEKDRVENALHRQVCKNQIDLKTAQEIIRTNWVSCFKQIQAHEVCQRENSHD